ncbi:hypothetical protein DM39_5844 [Burkholderia cenocepacia]|uniref:Fimbrial chaperone EcpE n=1 Tax=Burkholderia cenocepacia TaxID=95486 RepID=A0AAN0RXH9_9BURK|nr:hypothetical protein DM39_5844 [Burkholderia cenocepacia]
MLVYRLVFALVAQVTIAPSTYALNVGDLTYFMRPDQNFIAREVLNDSGQARIYSVTVEEAAPPYIDANTWRPKGGELLYAPKRLVLRGHQANWLRLYYKGPADDQSRFYRITFTEERAMTREADDAVNIRPRLSLDTVLVVQPRQPRQSYRVDGTKLVNDGNTTFLATIHGHCEVARQCFVDRYLAPGFAIDFGALVEPEKSNRAVLWNGGIPQEKTINAVNQNDVPSNEAIEGNDE